MTGNSVTLVVDEILKNSRNGAHGSVTQELIDHFVESQILNPNDPLIHQNSPTQILERVSKGIRPLFKNPLRSGRRPQRRNLVSRFTKIENEKAFSAAGSFPK